jgi:hypothetical protein
MVLPIFQFEPFEIFGKKRAAAGCAAAQLYPTLTV